MRNNIFSNDMYFKMVSYISSYYWEARGKPIPPPPLVKIKIIKEYAKLFSSDTFVETGTYLGGTVSAVRHNFHEIFSIELSDSLYERARRRFAGFSHIKILHGDSSEVLPKILSGVSGRCLFWLDGHYSWGDTAKGETECPIVSELETVISRKSNDDVILIDDARCYVGKGNWPHIEELRKLVYNLNPDLVFEIEDDIIRIHSC